MIRTSIHNNRYYTTQIVTSCSQQQINKKVQTQDSRVQINHYNKYNKRYERTALQIDQIQVNHDKLKRPLQHKP